MLGRAIDLGNPIADHPLNRGLKHWWLGLPSRSGGQYFPDLWANGSHSASLFEGTADATWTAARNPGFAALQCSRSGIAYGLTAGANIDIQGLSAATLIVSGTIASYQTSASPWLTGCAETGVAAGAGTRFFSLLFGDGNNAAGAGYPNASIRTTAAANVAAIYSTEHYGDLTAGPARYWMAATYDGTTLTLYVDGISRATNTTSGTLDTIRPMYLGAQNDYGDGNRALDGTVEECRLYPGVCLPADRIWELYRETLLGYPQTLRRVGGGARFSAITNPVVTLADIPWIYTGGSPDPDDPYNIGPQSFGDPGTGGLSPPPPPPPPPPGGGGGGSQGRSPPIVPRVPVGQYVDRRLARHTDIVAEITNSLLRQGRIVQIEGGYDLRSGFAEPRPPTADDDVDDGAFVGCFWFDTANNRLYICTSPTAGAAAWSQITLT